MKRNLQIGLVSVAIVSALALWRVSSVYRRASRPEREFLAPRRYRTGQGVDALAFSPDGNTLLGVDRQNTLRFWDVHGGRRTTMYPVAIGWAKSAVWARGTIALTSDSDSVILWDVARRVSRSVPAFNFGMPRLGRKLLSRRTGSLIDLDASSCELSPDGMLTACAGVRENIGVRETEGKTLFVLRRSLHGTLARFNCGLSISPDGRTLAVASLLQKTALNTPRDEMFYFGVNWPQELEIALFDAHTGRPRRAWRSYSAPSKEGEPQHNFSTFAMAFSPDGTQLIGTNGGGVQVWDALSGEQLRSLDIPQKHRLLGVQRLAISPNGRLVARAGLKATDVWNLRTGALLQSFASGYFTGALAFSPDSRYLATSSNDAHNNGVAKLWDGSDLGR